MQTRRHSVVRLLEACRQIRNEAKAMFYSLNHLCVLGFYGLARFSTSESFQRALYIRSLTIDIDPLIDGPKSSSVVFCQLSQLKALQVRADPLKVVKYIDRLRELLGSLSGLDDFKFEWNDGSLRKNSPLIQK